MLVFFEKNKFWTNLCMVLKVLIVLYATVFVQSIITYDECNDVTDQMHVMVWLTYETVVFYLNLIGIIVFLFISTRVQFKTVRDRLGLAGDLRKKLDFLTYASDDLHWW